VAGTACIGTVRAAAVPCGGVAPSAGSGSDRAGVTWGGPKKANHDGVIPDAS
jgi:hypothetical protein